MFRIIQASNSLPFSFIGDPNSQYQSGQIAQLNAFGNQVVCGVSDGTAPIGIIDDNRTTAFTRAAIDEVLIVSAIGVDDGNGNLVTAADIKQELENATVISQSFLSDIPVELIAKNGVITIPAGTELNFSSTDSGTPDAVRVVVNYSFQIPNIPGDDTTAGSGRVTVWVDRLIGATDQFETNVRYPLNAPLFVSESGLLTSRMPFTDAPIIAQVTAPPSPIGGFLEFLWF